MKEMTSVATTMMSEEEKAELEREMNEARTPGAGDATSVKSTPASPSPIAHAEDGPPPASPAPHRASHIPSPARSASPASVASPGVAPAAATSGQDPLAAAVKSPASSSTSNLKEGSGKDVHKSEKEKEKDTHAKKRAKLTPEQKKKLQELDEERKRAMEERVETLAKKLVDRLRPFVEAKHPGDKDDPETKAFEAKMRREADDLKLESFGVELLHTIGNVYIMKATSFLKSRKFLGM